MLTLMRKRFDQELHYAGIENPDDGNLRTINPYCAILAGVIDAQNASNCDRIGA
jgi:hypothetical protein